MLNVNKKITINYIHNRLFYFTVSLYIYGFNLLYFINYLFIDRLFIYLLLIKKR